MGKRLHKLVYFITRLKIKSQILLLKASIFKKNNIVIWMVMAISTIHIYRILIYLTRDDELILVYHIMHKQDHLCTLYTYIKPFSY